MKILLKKISILKRKQYKKHIKSNMEADGESTHLVLVSGASNHLVRHPLAHQMSWCDTHWRTNLSSALSTSAPDELVQCQQFLFLILWFFCVVFIAKSMFSYTKFSKLFISNFKSFKIFKIF